MHKSARGSALCFHYGRRRLSIGCDHSLPWHFPHTYSKDRNRGYRFIEYGIVIAILYRDWKSQLLRLSVTKHAISTHLVRYPTWFANFICYGGGAVYS